MTLPVRILWRSHGIFLIKFNVNAKVAKKNGHNNEIVDVMTKQERINAEFESLAMAELRAFSSERHRRRLGSCTSATEV